MVFQGTIPASARSMVLESVQQWPGHVPIQVLCSGNLTIERTLAGLGRSLRGNDVQLYSCSLGMAAAGQRMDVKIRDRHLERFGWMQEGIDFTDPINVAAAVVLTTGFGPAVLKPQHRYYGRLADGYRRDWPRIHGNTAERMRKGLPKLDAFHVQGAMEMDLPPELGIVSFPPFWAGGYESLFKAIHELFEWPAPEYGELGEEQIDQLIDRITAREHWMPGLPIRPPRLEPFIRGMTRTSNLGMPIFFFGNAARRLMVPRQKVEALLIPRLGAAEEIAGPLTLAKISDGQFTMLRSTYLNRNITPGAPGVAFAVIAGGKVIGSCAFATHQTMKRGASDGAIYMLSDFPIAPSRYSRLAKLVLYAALSKETKAYLEQLTGRRVTCLVSTAFTDRPVSMKYRGLFELLSRKEGKDGHGKWMLQYSSPSGRWTLQEGLDQWKKKHAGCQRESPDSTPGA